MTQLTQGKTFSTPPLLDKSASSGSRRFNILLIPLALTVALCTGMGWYVWDLYNNYKKIQTQSLRIQDLSNQITYLDEVLTSSARLAATTGDKRWEERYLSYVPQLDTALAEAQELLPGVFEDEAFAKTNAANDRLIAMEEQAFELIGQGKADAARAVLLSPEYEQQKEIYAEGLNEATTALENLVEGNIRDKTQQAFTVLVIIGVALLILLFAWIAVLRMIRRYIQTINDTGMALSTNSHEIVATMEQQERTINEQATAVSQTTTTMEELGASTRQSTEQAEASASGARQALDLTEEGNQSVEQTLSGISTLKEQVGAIAEQIMRLSEQTGQIGLVSDLVGNLANQTNMLALNASVEAVRAGEQGKGFSVVAGEIRKLADQSKQSAEKINDLVREIQASINSSVMVTDEGTKKASEGIRLAQETAQTFNGLADAVNNVFLNSQQISMTAKQQAVAVQQVVAAMNELNSAAKESASGINQVKVSSQQLDNAAKKLKAVV